MTYIETTPAATTRTSEPTRRRPKGSHGVSKRYRTGATRWFILAIVGLCVLLTLFPFGLAIINAFKAPQQYAATGPLSLPSSIYTDGIVNFWQQTDFPRKLLNSVLISTVVAIGAVILSLFNAYALGIGRVRGRLVFLLLMLLAITIPQEMLVYPIYYMAKAAGLFDTELSVMIVFIVLQSAFGTYLLSATLTAFPKEILEAARIDGASRWTMLWHVVFPVVRPTLTVLATFFFIWTWNEFLIPLILLVSNDNQTVSVAMGTLKGQFTSDPVTQAAASLLGMAPAILFFLIFQRTLMRGTTVGAVK